MTWNQPLGGERNFRERVRKPKVSGKKIRFWPASENERQGERGTELGRPIELHDRL